MAKARKKRPSKDEVKSAARRAEARSSGKPIEAAKVEIDPVITKAAAPEPEVGRGRPTDYRPEFVGQVQQLCALGATDPEIADFFNVTVRTIHRWKHAYPDFCHALVVGKNPADNRTERSMFQMANGYYVIEQQAIKVKTGKDTEEVKIVDVERYIPPQPTAAMFWLKNRLKDRWRDRHEHAVGTLGEFAAMDETELLHFIQQEAADLVKEMAPVTKSLVGKVSKGSTRTH